MSNESRKRLSMNDGGNSVSDFRQSFASAVNQYDIRLVVHGFVAGVLFFLSAFLSVFLLVYVYRSYGESDQGISKVVTAEDECVCRNCEFMFIPAVLCAGSISIIYLSYQVKRARRNSNIKCPHCQNSVVKQRRVVQWTGYCPLCKVQLMEGKFASTAEVKEHIEKIRPTEKRAVRFSWIATLAGIPIGTVIYLWSLSTAEAAGGTVRGHWTIPFLTLVIPVLLWGISKFSGNEYNSAVQLFHEIGNEV